VHHGHGNGQQGGAIALRTLRDDALLALTGGLITPTVRPAARAIARYARRLETSFNSWEHPERSCAAAMVHPWSPPSEHFDPSGDWCPMARAHQGL
jgi:hypothetical protein